MGNLTGKKLSVISRRAFNKGSVMAAAFLSYYMLAPASARAARHPISTADAFLHLTKQGLMEIHSGGGHQSLYGERPASEIVAEVMGCSPELCKIQYGDNPAQLPALLGQFSNHLSFTTEQTTRKAALLMIESLKQQAAFKLGGRADNFQVANGLVFTPTQSISFKEIAQNCRLVLTEGQVCENTLNLMKNCPSQGIQIAVGEIT